MNGTRHERRLEDLELDVDRAVLALLREYRKHAAVALGDIQPWTPHQTRASLGGDCEACDRYVAGSVNDRLVSGLCFGDYRAWKRAQSKADYTDRGVWLIARRAYHRLTPTVEHIDPTNKYGMQASGTTATILGVDVPIEVAVVLWAFQLDTSAGWCSHEAVNRGQVV